MNRRDATLRMVATVVMAGLAVAATWLATASGATSCSDRVLAETQCGYPVVNVRYVMRDAGGVLLGRSKIVRAGKLREAKALAALEGRTAEAQVLELRQGGRIVVDRKRVGFYASTP